MNDALRVSGLSKRFGGQCALDGVALEVARGEVHGLVGANGSGKSTLVKLLAGYHAPERGAEIAIGGRALPAPVTRAALASCGARFVHQDLGLVPGLTIAENLGLDGGARAAGLAPLRHRADRRACERRLRAFALGYPPDRLVADLGIAERVMVAVARAAGDDVRATAMVVVDEATSGLPREEAARVLRLIRDAAAAGAGVLFVSHRLEEVLETCDRVTVLRDGRVAGAGAADALDVAALMELMLGEPAAALGAPRARAERSAPAPSADAAAAATPAPRLDVRGLRGGLLRGVDLALAPGEVVGVTGLLGCGADELGRLLFGAERPRAGTLALDGRPLPPLSPRRAVQLGIAYVPASRELSLTPGHTVRENLTIVEPRAFARRGVLVRRLERAAAAEAVARFGVHPRDPERQVSTLSGGNQQKVALARWLRRAPRLLVLDEPTRGIDVRAREEVYALLRAAAAEGLAILVATSDLEEAEALCDRVLVLRDGALAAELRGAEIEAHALARLAQGEPAATAAAPALSTPEPGARP